MNNRENLLGVLGTLYKWRKAIFTVCFLSALISIVLSLMMPNYYEATTSFYAASPDMTKPERMFGTSSYDMKYYGESSDIDRIITIAKSSELVEFLVNKFKLFEHYDIDPAKDKAAFFLRRKLNSQYNVKKTKLDAIDLSIEDEDKNLAAEMANAARDKIDQIAQSLIKGSQEKLLKTLEKSIARKENQLNKIGDSLIFVRNKYGIFDTETQTEVLSSLITQTESKLTREKERLLALQESGGISRDSINFLKAKVRGLQKEFEGLTSNNSSSKFNLNKFNEGKGKVEILDQLYLQTYQQLSYDQTRLQQLESVYNSEISAIHLVESAAVPIIKSRPKRSIIVISSLLVSFLFCAIAALIFEAYKDINWKEVFNG